MKSTFLTFPNKKIRAAVIASYVEEASYPGVVAFSCGNATRELREAGLNVLDISEEGDLSPTDKWWKPEEVRRVFPSLLDATSGHLPLFLMVRIASEFRKHLGKLPKGRIIVPTGSGETIICLKLAYPSKQFTAQYNINKATAFNEEAPLNSVVASWFPVMGRRKLKFNDGR